MAKLTKRQKAIAEKIEAGRAYAIGDAVALLTEISRRDTDRKEFELRSRLLKSEIDRLTGDNP